MMTHKVLLKQAPCALGVKSEVLIEGETILIVIDHLQPLPLFAAPCGEGETGAAAAASLFEMASVTGAGIAATFAHHLHTLSASADGDFESLKALTNAEFAKVLASEDTKEGLMAFIDKRAPQWKGA